MIRRSGRRRGRRSWRERLLISFNVVMIIAALTAAASLRYTYGKATEVNRVALGNLLTTPPKMTNRCSQLRRRLAGLIGPGAPARGR